MGPESVEGKDAVSRRYVLVHGGMMPGAIWDEVASILRSRGHEVFCPTLPDAQTSNLDNDIDVVCKVIKDNKLDHVVLAGHSFGGIVITGAYDRMPDNVATLVFFDTSIPENGQSLRQLRVSGTLKTCS
jgi:pimeloyl-ACP methyl ester carboxylesterase